MKKLDELLRRYTLLFFGLIEAYCGWAKSQAKNQADLIVLGLGPVVLLGLALLFLPNWLGKTLALVLLAPTLYVVYMILRVYAVRGRK